MSREASGLVAAVAVVVIVVVLAGAGVFAVNGSSVSAPGGRVPDPPDDGSHGVVAELRTSGGLSILGVQVSAKSHVVLVSMVVPAECVVRDGAGNEELRRDGVCADLPAHGEMSGGGTTATGATLAAVSVEVSRECYESLSPGDAWPSSAPACAELDG